MKKEELTVNFKFSYGHLKQVADNLLQLLDRDNVQFVDRGFSPAKRTAIVNLLNAFVACPDEEAMLGARMKTTELKDIARDVLETQLRSLFLDAKKQFGENSGEYRAFGNADISQQTDDEIVRTAKLASIAATTYLTQLANQGVTTAKITLLNTNRTVFDNAIDTQQNAISNKDIAAENRIRAANALYAEIVNWSDTGKDIWYTISESKYNDYVIYNTPTGTADDIVPPPSV